MKPDGFFYLGKTYSLKNGKISDNPFNYESDDLTTHGVVFGMTGSGKTGLCIDLLEEDLLDLQEELEDLIADIEDNHYDKADQVEDFEIRLEKDDILVSKQNILWKLK